MSNSFDHIAVIDIGQTSVKPGLFDTRTYQVIATFTEVPTAKPLPDEDPYLAKARYMATIKSAFDQITNNCENSINILSIASTGPLLRVSRSSADSIPNGELPYKDGKEILIVPPNAGAMSDYLHAAGIAFDIQSQMQLATGLPTFFTVDSAANLIAEQRVGAAKGEPNSAILITGTGIGYMAMKDGRIAWDENFNGPEPCDTPVSELNMTIEEATGGNGLIERFGRKPSPEDSEMREFAIRHQAPIVRDLMKQTDARVLVLTGGVADHLGPEYASAMAIALADGPDGINVKVRPAGLKRHVGLVGAGLVAVDALGIPVSQ